MKKIFIFSLATGITAMLSSCDMTKPAYMSLTPPDGPPEYRQGWEDGCESARSANANQFYKMFLTVHQDEELAKNKMYYQVWKDAYSYCWYYQVSTSANALGNFK